MYLVVYIDTNCDCMDRHTVCGVYSTREKASVAIAETSRYMYPYIQLEIVDVSDAVDKPVARYHNIPSLEQGWYPQDLT